MLECELVTSKQLLSCRKQQMLQDFLIDSSSDIPPRIMMLCRNLMLDFVQLGFRKTRGSRFPSKMQNFDSSEKIIRDHSSTAQYHFSMAQVSRFLHCLKFRRGFTVVCGWRSPFPLFCDWLLIVMQAHHQHSTALLKLARAHQFRQLPIVPFGGNMFAATILASR